MGNDNAMDIDAAMNDAAMDDNEDAAMNVASIVEAATDIDTDSPIDAKYDEDRVALDLAIGEPRYEN